MVHNDLKASVMYLGKRLVRVSFLFLILSLAYHLRSENFKSEELRVYPDLNIKYFTLGYQYPLADMVFLKVLVNMDFCEKPKVVDPDFYQGHNIENILTTKLSASRCHLGWVYQWTNLLTDLDPRFYRPYSIFGTSLSVLVEDREGARLIYEKGLQQFPKDWVLNYRAAYHYLYEIQNPQRAAELALASYKNGGPDFLVALASQLYTRVGKAAFAKTFLEDFIQEHPESKDLEQIQKRLREANDALIK
jgi:hypothetical protein